MVYIILELITCYILYNRFLYWIYMVHHTYHICIYIKLHIYRDILKINFLINWKLPSPAGEQYAISMLLSFKCSNFLIQDSENKHTVITGHHDAIISICSFTFQVNPYFDFTKGPLESGVVPTFLESSRCLRMNALFLYMSFLGTSFCVRNTLSLYTSFASPQGHSSLLNTIFFS